MASNKPRRFINYPDPKAGPAVPYRNDRKPNPAIRGVAMVVSAFLMEWLGIVRSTVWRNGGFGDLKGIRTFIEDYEPRFDPTVIPVPSEDETEAEVAHKQSTLPAHPDGPSQYYSVADYHEMYLSGELTPLAVVKAILPLIRRDTSPPGEHSMAWFDTKVDLVLKAAEASTLRYKENKSLGLLDGVPTAVKDEYDIEGYTTSLGSRNDYTERTSDGKGVTSWCVRKLEDAGAIVLGKLSMHEFGLDTTGNNPIWGTPRNPYNPQYYTGGSSSGSAYAVAAGLLPVALGSDGGGSIRIPSAFCGVFGLKPTHGRVSFSPGPNHSLTCAVKGPIAADMRSLAAFFDVIGAPDPQSQFPQASPLILSPSEKRGKVLGIPEVWFSQSTPAIQQLCRSMISRLVSEYGYSTVPIEIPFLVEGQIAHAMTVLTDGSTLLPDTNGLTPGNKILLAIGRTTPATDYLLAQKLRALLMRHLASLWKTYPGMIIVTPTTKCAGWQIRTEAELKYGVCDGDTTIDTMAYVWMGNFCGLPGLNVPAGYIVPEGRPGAGEIANTETIGKVPVGLMAMGEWTDEHSLLHFGLDSEGIFAEERSRPPNWVDVVQRAKDVMRNGEEDLIELQT